MQFAPTLLIRLSKRGKAKVGMPKAIMYRNNIFDPASDLEALIEAYGANNVKRLVDTIEARRNNELAEHPGNFKVWEL